MDTGQHRRSNKRLVQIFRQVTQEKSRHIQGGNRMYTDYLKELVHQLEVTKVLDKNGKAYPDYNCLLYTSPSPRDS